MIFYEVNVEIIQLTVKGKNFGITLGIRDISLNIIEKKYASKSQHCLTGLEAVKAAIDCSSTTLLEAIKFEKMGTNNRF